MSVDTKELKFTATEEKGEVSAIVATPAAAKVLLVLESRRGHETCVIDSCRN